MSITELEASAETDSQPTPREVLADALENLSPSPADLSADPEWERETIPADADVAMVFSNWVRSGLVIYALFDDEAEPVFTTPGNHALCTGCDANEAVSIGMGTPAETAQEKRDRQNCQHANLARQCGKENRCGDCGSWEFEQSVQPITRRAPGGDSVHVGDLVEAHCGDCGGVLL